MKKNFFNISRNSFSKLKKISVIASLLVGCNFLLSSCSRDDEGGGGGLPDKKEGTGVYAGIWFLGAYRYDLAIYFRDDGTYTESLGRNDWRTHISGRYTKNGTKVKTTSNSGRSAEYEYRDNFRYMLASGAYYMFKVEAVSQIPASGYRFRNIAVLDSGGNYTASGVSGYLYFDGKGNFSNDKSAFSQTSGSGVGSGSYTGRRYVGTYTIKNGDLTLKYSNGSTSTHSFFYGKPTKKGGDATIVVDGNTYFQMP